MAFTTGTATDHNDLLDLLHTYLVAQGWTSLAYSAGATIHDPSVMSVRGPGAGPGLEVFVNVRTMRDLTIGSWSWELRCAVDYDPVAPWGSQLSESPAQVYFNTWENPIDYWFFVNDRRFVVVAKCSTNYMSCHAGFFLPWGTPPEYPFPLYVAGDFHEPRPFSYNYAARRMFVDPGYQDTLKANAWMRTPQGDWWVVGNDARSSNTNLPLTLGKTLAGVMWPYHSGSGASYTLNTQYFPQYWSGGDGSADAGWAGEAMVPTRQNERPLIPCMLIAADQAPLGVLDGVYAVAGTGLTTEQLITIGGRDFRVFQNIQRNSPDDFFAVEEV